jgi:hypothetical protein
MAHFRVKYSSLPIAPAFTYSTTLITFRHATVFRRTNCPKLPLSLVPRGYL